MKKKTREPQPSHYPRGLELLHDPVLNKGGAFTEAERDALGLHGLLPPTVYSQNTQMMQVIENFNRKPNDLEKYIYLMALQDLNESLFYRVVIERINEMMPIIYTPTVGQACQLYGHILRRPRGMYLSIKDAGNIAKILRNWPSDEVRIIVVTDGERILGLGDLGCSGMGIPVGKLSLYTACAGVDPSACLPVTLDVGTNNEELLEDPLYIGIRRHRVRGEEYDGLVDEFVTAVNDRWPEVLIQFEDFANTNAFRLLKRYRDRACCFNDDIQGTAGVALAGIIAAMRELDASLTEQKFLFLGAGEAGTGIGHLLVTAMMENGLPETDALQRCWFVDSKGLVVKARGDLQEHKRAFAHDHEPLTDLQAAVEALQPTALIGVSGQPGTFGGPVIEAMARINECPIIFALSNPTSKAECTAEQAYGFSEGRALFASGSPFKPVVFNKKMHVPGQGNNAYIFPGMGLGITAFRIRRVPDELFLSAARALAHSVSPGDLRQGSLYPPLTKIRNVSMSIAEAVGRKAYELGIADEPCPPDLAAHLVSIMHDPRYGSYL